MPSTTGLPMSGWGCGACNTSPTFTSFRGAHVGIVTTLQGTYATRLPEFIKEDNWTKSAPIIDPDTGVIKESTGDWTYNVVHNTQSAKIEPIEFQDKTYVCVGMAGSQYADGSFLISQKPGVVWMQVFWADESEDINDHKLWLSGFVAVKVWDSTLQEQEPTNHEFTLLDAWIITDEKWDSPEKICGYFRCDENGAAKVVCGPDSFCIFTRRIGPNNKIKYWNIGATTAVTKTWENPESLEDASGEAAFFSSFVFPMGLCLYSQHQDFNEQILRLSWKEGGAIGLVKLNSMTHDFSDPPARGSVRNAGFYPYEIRINSDVDVNNQYATIEQLRHYIHDWDAYGTWWTDYDVQGGMEVPFYSYFVLPEEDYVPINGGQAIGGPNDVGTFYKWSGCATAMLTRGTRTTGGAGSIRVTSSDFPGTSVPSQDFVYKSPTLLYDFDTGPPFYHRITLQPNPIKNCRPADRNLDGFVGYSPNRIFTTKTTHFVQGISPPLNIVIVGSSFAPTPVLFDQTDDMSSEQGNMSTPTVLNGGRVVSLDGTNSDLNRTTMQWAPYNVWYYAQQFEIDPSILSDIFDLDSQATIHYYSMDLVTFSQIKSAFYPGPSGFTIFPSYGWFGINGLSSTRLSKALQSGDSELIAEIIAELYGAVASQNFLQTGELPENITAPDPASIATEWHKDAYPHAKGEFQNVTYQHHQLIGYPIEFPGIYKNSFVPSSPFIRAGSDGPRAGRLPQAMYYKEDGTIGFGDVAYICHRDIWHSTIGDLDSVS